jgi:predicted transcriptional regulator
MYKCYMSYSQVQDYVTYMEKKRLLKYDEESRSFKATRNGIEAYESLKNAQLLMAD